MDRVRVGVVGAGAFGRHHARVYASLPGAVLTGVADVRPGRAEEVAAPLGAEAFTDPAGLFGKVDAVSIAVPTTLHADIGEQFLQRGIHVLVEKPIAHTLEDADRLVRAAAAGGVTTVIARPDTLRPPAAASSRWGTWNASTPPSRSCAKSSPAPVFSSRTAWGRSRRAASTSTSSWT